MLRATLLIINKDLLIEWRTRARLNALVFFALATLLMFSFALGPDTVALRRNAAGYLWLGILFASVLSLGESFRIETENLALDGVRLAPADPRAVFLGKAIGNTLMLWILALVITPVTIGLYDVGGRLVRTLAERAFPAGAQRLAWDGTDDAGRRLARGVYFARTAGCSSKPPLNGSAARSRLPSRSR